MHSFVFSVCACNTVFIQRSILEGMYPNFGTKYGPMHLFIISQLNIDANIQSAHRYCLLAGINRGSSGVCGRGRAALRLSTTGTLHVTKYP